MADYVSDLKLGAKLGSGAFGEVYLAEDPAHGTIAVKALKRTSLHDDATWRDYKSAYLDEAKYLAKASHRNTVQLHHVVEAKDGNCVFICMAFCSGGSLQDQFEVGPMTLGDVRKVATEVLMGLGAMHARGMVHRDIKPANILLSNNFEAKIGDFGLVTDALILGYASQAGYSDHIAYEVWHGKGTSVKSDIWALGMTLFRLLHGRDWYVEAPDPRDLIKLGGFADTLRWLPHVPREWRRLIRKMLNDDDNLRFQNTAQTSTALAVVPILPRWQCTVASDLICWELTKGGRQILVEWRRMSPRKHKWDAWSKPVGVGRLRRLSGSKGIVGSSAATKDLENFFQTFRQI